jgi:hypothetical protein
MVRTRVWTGVVYLPIRQWKKGHGTNGRTTSSITGYMSTYVCPVRRRVLHTPRQPVFAVFSACILSEQILHDDSAAHNADATRSDRPNGFLAWCPRAASPSSGSGSALPREANRLQGRVSRRAAPVAPLLSTAAGTRVPCRVRVYAYVVHVEYSCRVPWYLPWYTSSTNVRVCGTRVLVL